MFKWLPLIAINLRKWRAHFIWSP